MKETRKDIQNEEMDMKHIWYFCTDDTDEEAEDRTKGSWKSCILDVFRSTSSMLITILEKLNQKVSDGLQSTTNCIHSVLKAIYDQAFNLKEWSHTSGLPPVPTTTRALLLSIFPSLEFLPLNYPLNPRLQPSALGKLFLALRRVQHRTHARSRCSSSWPVVLCAN